MKKVFMFLAVAAMMTVAASCNFSNDKKEEAQPAATEQKDADKVKDALKDAATEVKDAAVDATVDAINDTKDAVKDALDK